MPREPLGPNAPGPALKAGAQTWIFRASALLSVFPGGPPCASSTSPAGLVAASPASPPADSILPHNLVMVARTLLQHHHLSIEARRSRGYCSPLATPWACFKRCWLWESTFPKPQTRQGSRRRAETAGARPRVLDSRRTGSLRKILYEAGILMQARRMGAGGLRGGPFLLIWMVGWLLIVSMVRCADE